MNQPYILSGGIKLPLAGTPTQENYAHGFTDGVRYAQGDIANSRPTGAEELAMRYEARQELAHGISRAGAAYSLGLVRGYRSVTR